MRKALVILNASLSFVPVLRTDSYTTEDIVYKWNATDVSVGTEEMAQFGYKGAKLSSDEDIFTIGNKCYYLHSPQLSTPPSTSPPSLLPDPSSFPPFLRSFIFQYFQHFSSHVSHKQHAIARKIIIGKKGA